MKNNEQSNKQNSKPANKRKWLGICAAVVVMIGIAAGAAIYLYPTNPAGNATKQPNTENQTSEATTQLSEAANQTSNNTTRQPETAEPEPGTQLSDAEAETQQDLATQQPETETQEPEVIEITISAVGDLTFGRNQKASYSGSFDEYYDDYGVDYFLQNVVDVFAADDCTIGNLEGVLTESTDIRASKEWNHKGRPEYVDLLTRGSIEVVSLGNNHIMDYNEEGVKDTIDTLENAGVTYAISGVWGDKYGMYETEKGIKIGFVSVNEYYEGNAVYTFLEDGLKQLREQGADLVFALVHWGGDKTHIIEDDQYTMGRWCVDQGYDLVLGCHPHVLQGIECYNGKYIVYSMGNFCYGGSKNPKEKDSMIFQQTFTFVDGVLQENTTDIRAIPCRLSGKTSKNDYSPVILDGDEAAETIQNLNSYSEEFGIAFDNEGYLKQ